MGQYGNSRKARIISKLYNRIIKYNGKVEILWHDWNSEIYLLFNNRLTNHSSVISNDKLDHIYILVIRVQVSNRQEVHISSNMNRDNTLISYLIQYNIIYALLVYYVTGPECLSATACSVVCLYSSVVQWKVRVGLGLGRSTGYLIPRRKLFA